MLFIRKAIIENFKSLRVFEIEFNENVSILVGNNNQGKTSIFDAINLALTGIINGKNIFSEISASLFNVDAVNEYIKNIQSGILSSPPQINIELFFTEEVDNEKYRGNNNNSREECSGIKMIIELDPNCANEYEIYIKEKEKVNTLPIEYYHCLWYTFADNNVSRICVPVRSNFIDISNNRFLGNPDKQVLKIVENALTIKERTDLTLSYRKLKENFSDDSNIKLLNKKIADKYKIVSDKEISLNVEIASRTNWESSFTTYFNEIPFNYIGKGEQSAFKIKLALASNEKCNVVLIEEPENHLSYSNMSMLIDDILSLSNNVQIILSTHSAYVLNKLNLRKVILLQNQNKMTLNSLKKETAQYFEKIPGFDTLRLILANKVFLVEGPSDELVIQKLYLQKYGKLPIANGIDVISVRGTSFARYLDIAKELKTKVIIIPDNDRKTKKLESKYNEYISENIVLAMCKDDDLFTLEKILVEKNSLEKLNIIFNKEFISKEEMLEYMLDNKSDCALMIFNSKESIAFIEEVYNVI